MMTPPKFISPVILKNMPNSNLIGPIQADASNGTLDAILILQNSTTFAFDVYYPNSTIAYTSGAYELNDALAYAYILTPVTNVTLIHIVGNVVYDHTVIISVSGLRIDFDSMLIRTAETAMIIRSAYGTEVNGLTLEGGGGILVYVDNTNMCRISINNLYAHGPAAVYLNAYDYYICANVFTFARIIGGTRQIRLVSNTTWIGSNIFNLNYMQCYNIEGVLTRCISIELNQGGLNQFNYAIIESSSNNTAIYSEDMGGDYFTQCQIFDIGEGSLAVNNSGRMFCTQTMWALSKVNNTGLIYYTNHLDGDTWECSSFLDNAGTYQPLPSSSIDSSWMLMIIIIIFISIVAIVSIYISPKSENIKKENKKRNKQPRESQSSHRGSSKGK
jgi:hypothetical protein